MNFKVQKGQTSYNWNLDNYQRLKSKGDDDIKQKFYYLLIFQKLALDVFHALFLSISSQILQLSFPSINESLFDIKNSDQDLTTNWCISDDSFSHYTIPQKIISQFL